MKGRVNLHSEATRTQSLQPQAPAKTCIQAPLGTACSSSTPLQQRFLKRAKKINMIPERKIKIPPTHVLDHHLVRYPRCEHMGMK